MSLNGKTSMPTIRISRIPYKINQGTLTDLLKAKGELLALSLCPDDIFDGPSEGRYQVATATFEEIPSDFIGQRPTSIGDVKVTIGTDFMGLTPLYHPSLKPVLEYVI